jgi:hypothetical protein
MSQVPPPPPPAGAIPQQYSLNPQSKTSGAAIGSLICGILGCVPWVTGLLAIVLGIVGIKNTKDPLTRGRGLAVAGLVLGCVSVVLWTLFGGAIFAFFKATGPAREQATAFVHDLDKGDVATAHTRVTSDISADELKLVADRMKTWGGVKSIKLVGMNMNAQAGKQTTTVVTGAVEFGNLNKSFTATLVKEGDTEKIREYRFD